MGEDVALRMARRAEEGAERAARGADVGRVNIAVNDEGAEGFGMELTAARVGGRAEFGEREVEERAGLGGGEAGHQGKALTRKHEGTKE